MSHLLDRPVVEFGAVPGYGPIFNAGVIEVDGVFHLFARGVRDGYARNRGSGPRFLDCVSDVLVFTSDDGLEYRFQQRLASGATEGAHSLEDPRVQRLRSSDGLQDGRVALIHRIHPDMQLALFDSLEHLYASGREYWDEHLGELDQHVLIRGGERDRRLGALVLVHAVGLEPVSAAAVVRSSSGSPRSFAPRNHYAARSAGLRTPPRRRASPSSSSAKPAARPP